MRILRYWRFVQLASEELEDDFVVEIHSEWKSAFRHARERAGRYRSCSVYTAAESQQ